MAAVRMVGDQMLCRPVELVNLSGLGYDFLDAAHVEIVVMQGELVRKGRGAKTPINS